MTADPQYKINEGQLFDWVLRGKITKGEADIIRGQLLSPDVCICGLSQAECQDRSDIIHKEALQQGQEKVLSAVMQICKRSKKTIESRHDAEYHTDARMDEVTDIIVKVGKIRLKKDSE